MKNRETEGKRYLSLSDYFLNTFDGKVRKISLNLGFSCPNRDGTKGRGGCIFCSVDGSASKNIKNSTSLLEQIEAGRSYFKKRYASEGYIAYFQPFTSTYGPPDRLEEAIETITKIKDFIGLAVSTRPDCLDEKIIKIFNKFKSMFRFFWVELGLQTIREKSYLWMNRQDSLSSYINSHEMLAANEIPIVAHIILGLPGEKQKEIVELAGFFRKYPVWGVKIHQLQAIRGTKLWKLYKNGEFEHLSVQDYFDLLVLFLEHLDPNTVIHRLIGDYHGKTLLFNENSDRISLKKEELLSKLDQLLKKRATYQGRKHFL